MNAENLAPESVVLATSPSMSDLTPAPAPAPPEPAETRFLKSLLFGAQGLRVGWSVLLFLVMTLLFMALLGTAAALRCGPAGIAAAHE